MVPQRTNEETGCRCGTFCPTPYYSSKFTVLFPCTTACFAGHNEYKHKYVFGGVLMKFLRNLLEDLEVLSKYHVEIFNQQGSRVDEVDVIAGNEKEAESLAIHKSRHDEATRALAVDQEDIE